MDKLRFGILMACVCVFLQGQAQRLDNYTVENGLAQSFVNTVAQDSEGFIWAGTQNGLSCFDGAQFKNYRSGQVGTDNILDNKVKRVAKDQRGGIWLIFNMGLQRWDATTNSFITVYEASPETGDITDICFDGENGLWILHEKGIRCYDIQRSQHASVSLVWRYDHWDLPSEYIRKGRLFCQNGHLIIYNRNKAWACNDKKFEWTRVLSDIVGDILIIWPDPFAKDTYWIQTTKGAKYVGAESTKWFPEIQHSWGLNNLPVMFGLSCIIPSRNRLFIWDGSSLKLFSEDFPFEILSVCSDAQKGLWLGTNAKGLYRYYFPEYAFQVYNAGEVVNFPVLKDNNNQIVAQSGDMCRPIVAEKALDRTANGKKYKAITLDAKGDYWLLDCNAQLTHPASNRAIQLRNLKPNDRVQRMAFLDDWVAFIIANNAFIACNTRTGNEIRIDNESSNRNFFTQTFNVHIVKSDKTGKVWLATSTGLMSLVFDWTNNKSVIDTLNILQGKEIYAVEMDKGGNQLWIGTNSGFYNYNIEGKTLIKVVTDQIGHDEVIYCLQNDHNGHLWMGTNSGLKKYDPVSKQSFWWTVSDGLPANEFNKGTVSISADGEIFMGTVRGGIRFYPQAIEKSSERKNTRIAQVLINGLTSVWGKEGSEVVCQEGDNLYIQFSLPDFNAGTKRHIRYRLINNDEEWSNLETSSLSFASLAAGTYQLEASLANEKNEWGTPVEIRIRVKMFWWKKVLIGALILLTIAGFVGMRWYYPRKKTAETLNAAGAEEPMVPALAGDDQEFQAPLVSDIVAELIEENFMHSDYGLPDILQKLKISKAHLHRKMIAEKGMTAVIMLKNRRMQAAEHLLIHKPDMTISEIAYSSGFNDPNYFSTVFSSFYGMSPTVFRQKNTG
ncbi:MAG: helix-turn-helix domain-containing protein [Saprospiraceae bacterium]|nr:helix-turn-helix domain-containing protein [Saprospiraceae bacterium]